MEQEITHPNKKTKINGCYCMDEFSHFHPIVNFIYFTVVLIFSMLLDHPVCRVITLTGAVVCALNMCRTKGLIFSLKFALPVILLTALINPAFNHAGFTILTYLPTGNPLTLESILYGISSGCMLGTLLIWFICINKTITSDKIIYLFGKTLPSLSLLLSMIIRFVPKFTSQMKTVSSAQKSIGKTNENNSILKKLRFAVRVFSITVTWSLENAIETADSMKSRGYGLKGRTSFSLYSIEARDKLMMIWLITGGFTVISGQLAGAVDCRYLPGIYMSDPTPFTIWIWIVEALICLTPVIINIREDFKWKKSKLKI